MEHVYTNRYRDGITFKRIDENTVSMEGGKWMRYGWPNKYDKAYAHYMEMVNELEEPDYDLLMEDLNENRVRAYTEAEFEKVMLGNLYDSEGKKAVPVLKGLWKHVYSDTSTYDMVDPSGGPYLCIGMDLKDSVGFPQSFKIEQIEVLGESVIFKNKK